MRVAFLCAMVLTFPAGAFGRNWNAGSTSDYLTVEWSRLGSEYIFTFKNPRVSDKPHTVIGWTLQPFNIPAPVDVVCPVGWQWRDKGGWRKFELAGSPAKYDIGGPALEPGESLIFTYTVGSDPALVNVGGPGGEGPAFLSHVAAVGGEEDGKWLPASVEGYQTWYDVTTVEYVPASAAPELPTHVVVFSSFCALACLKQKRARV